MRCWIAAGVKDGKPARKKMEDRVKRLLNVMGSIVTYVNHYSCWRAAEIVPSAASTAIVDDGS